ncbi:7,8-didemethyl-8-hydroxy-5-deazariboflavin synthase CofG [Tsukamurella sp. 8F]|uniref:7,8-didemethyl-8-hydroxy-5-deazariboflavin synthase CofG n=1 Tax=unclassified Tsukamurella TaxID=2633480 RepID=UPI0023B9AC7F|nr:MULTISPECIES: 7,8-didemethyl-8-hydroxy-5-deazariboflavin synthase CofG [unclassified Tsukamurella]MDF0531540.1 7,8-didemethyl-8-hydroxy-5-deazariboflavin synthase CofG [Tsukamurella sp. 8J]MDF0588848.1 7,8-didemethyl-8-hydroxy-5-deazariboflavin synthase CofG [Tsukamurella sp. 8F]
MAVDLDLTPSPSRSDAPSARPVGLDGALDRLGGGAPSRADAELLLYARGNDLDRLLAAAGVVRDRGLADAGRPDVITYSRKVFIPLTHLCRDRCHYCVFVQTPGKLARGGKSMYMTEDEVLEVARAGAKLGCKEALLTLGDRPEDRWPEARAWLDDHGYASTLDYVAAVGRRILDETGLLPHLNPGVMSWAELQRLRPVGPSMGMMLETTSTRIWETRGEAHFGSPDKDPAVRLRVLEDAGRSRIPFTTGVLLGIGETYADRVDAVLALRDSHERHGHIQEVIVQNFRAKPSTAMRGVVDLETQEYAAAVAVTRLLLGPGMRVQAPPNLTDEAELSLLVRAGIDDWGGVSPLTPDHVNPERPWPQIEELARLTAAGGYTLRERLTAHPHYIRAARGAAERREGAGSAASGQGTADWFDDRLAPHLLRQADDYGLARRDAYLESVLRRAADDPAGLTDAEYTALLHADGDDLETLAALADRVRRAGVGDTVTYAVNRNLDPALPLDRVAELVAEAVDLGATEVCAQGPSPDYLAFARAVKGAGAVHLHAFRPAEVLDGAARAGMSLPQWLAALQDAGVDTVPGTAARILDDDVRARLTAGQDIPADEWERAIRAAHAAGLRSTATMVYGHIESAAQQVAHLRRIARIAGETRGFTEFIAMPWLPTESPVEVLGSRGGPSLRESRAVHAVARLMLAGSIDHIQAAWTKLGLRGAQLVLAGGADDMGGVLLDGTIDPHAGPEQGRQLTVSDIAVLAGDLGRPVRQRTTVYGEVS